MKLSTIETLVMLNLEFKESKNVKNLNNKELCDEIIVRVWPTLASDKYASILINETINRLNKR